MKILALRATGFAILLSLVPLFTGCTKTAPEAERAIATRVLAEYVGKVTDPKGVLVISNPFSREAGRPAEVYSFERAGVEGLKQGFREKIPVTVAFPKLKADVSRDPGSVAVDPGTTTPLSFLVAEDSFSELVRQHPECDLVVSLIGLPANLAEFKEWSQTDGPKFALLLPDWRMIGTQEAILRAFAEKKLVAAVVNKPNAPTAGTENDYQQKFEGRFLLVTAENVEELLREYPAVFGLR